jgi:DNA polymerase-3 subunit alpha
LGGIITDKKIKYTKNNSVMAFITLEDLYGAIEVIVFPCGLFQIRSLLDEDKTVTIKGRISLKRR